MIASAIHAQKGGLQLQHVVQVDLGGNSLGELGEVATAAIDRILSSASLRILNVEQCATILTASAKQKARFRICAAQESPGRQADGKHCALTSLRQGASVTAQSTVLVVHCGVVWCWVLWAPTTGLM